MKKLSTIIYSYLFISLSFAFAGIARANLLNTEGQTAIKDNMKGAGDKGGYNTAGGDGSFIFSTVAGKVVAAVLGLLGIIFLIMIIIAGFNWMTAAGDAGKVDKAKATIFRGVIGLIIVVTAYIITAFVFKALSGLVGSPG
jgi:hypothetical protein